MTASDPIADNVHVHHAGKPGDGWVVGAGAAPGWAIGSADKDSGGKGILDLDDKPAGVSRDGFGGRFGLEEFGGRAAGLVATFLSSDGGRIIAASQGMVMAIGPVLAA